MTHTGPSVRHIFNTNGQTLCGRPPSKDKPADQWSPVCSVCKRTKEYGKQKWVKERS